jgi:ABC-type Na+ efflux pump permease subunit
MLPGPIFRREMKAVADRRGLFVFRSLLALTLGAAAVSFGLTVFSRQAWDRGIYEDEALRGYAGLACAFTAFIEIFFLALWTPSTVAPSIAEEREKDTLPLLLLTRLSRLELVATKLAGRLLPSLLMVLTGLPMMLAGAWAADLPALLIIEILGAMAGTTAVAASLAILASSRRDRSGMAQGEAFGWTMMWLVGFPVFALLPVRSGTLWGDLLVEIRRLASWIAPSSPLSLLTDPSWLAGSAGDTLPPRLATMLALQAAMIVLAMAGAVAGLRRREPHPHSWDLNRGYRPPVGDDPIFWREYILPWRGSRLPMVVIYARQILIVIRAILVLALQAFFLTLGTIGPLAIVLAAGWFGYHAFREQWGLGASPAESHEARDQLNLLVRGVTFMLGLMPMFISAAGVAAGITIERDKKTWEALLTTSLTGPEILSSKMRVAGRGVWDAGRWLILLWLLGIICGAVHPLGVVAAAMGMMLGTWLGLAMGAWAAIKPGATTQTANSTAGVWGLVLMAAGGLTAIAPLTSGRELAELSAFDARLPWLAAAVLAAALLAMAALARRLTRRCFDRFDEWVGRPHRAAMAGRGRDRRAVGAGRPVSPESVIRQGEPP